MATVSRKRQNYWTYACKTHVIKIFRQPVYNSLCALRANFVLFVFKVSYKNMGRPASTKFPFLSHFS